MDVIDWRYYRIRDCVIDGTTDLQPGDMVELRIVAQVIPMGDGSHDQPMQLAVDDWAGPTKVGEAIASG